MDGRPDVPPLPLSAEPAAGAPEGLPVNPVPPGRVLRTVAFLAAVLCLGNGPGAADESPAAVARRTLEAVYASDYQASCACV